MADRLFDNLGLDKEKPTTRRHAFIRRHWRKISSLWIFLFIGSISFSMVTLSKAELLGGLWITLLINLYFIFLKLSKTNTALGSLKEILTGTLFSLGVSYFPVVLFNGLAFEIVEEQIIFGLLCFANVLLISHWEHKIDAQQQEVKLSQTGLNRDALLKLLLAFLNCTAIVLVATNRGIFSWSVLLSSLAIWFLYLAARAKGAQNLKFLIDAPLMLPCLLFFIS
jgi:hypothetical protein